ncbi:MAG: hypothetical protein GF349_01430 [Candidatus Magasanikbacteria bacterium]|nr:hypothetical protein [Candidatus Magasanikbacteria bacterium]
MSKKINFTNAIKTFLGLFLFLLPWQTIWIYKEVITNKGKWEFFTLGFYASELFLWFTATIFIFWFYKKIKQKNKKINFSFTKDRLFVLSCVLFILYILAASFWSIDSDLAIQQFLRVSAVLILFLMLFIGPLKVVRQMQFFVVGSVIPVFLGIFQFLTQSTFSNKWLGLVEHPVWQAGSSIVSGPNIGRWLRSYGTFNHPNIFGGYLVLAILFTSILFLWTKKKLNKCLLLAIYLVQATALFFSFSRSAWISFFLMQILVIFVYYKNAGLKKYIPLASSVFLLFLIIVSFNFNLVSTRLAADSVTEIRAINERVEGYRTGESIFKDKSIFGVGPGNYTLALVFNNLYNSSLKPWEFQPVHNVFYLILAELGLVGIVLLLLVVAGYLNVIMSTEKDRWGRVFIIFFMFLSIMPIAMFDHYLWTSFPGMIMLSVYLAILSRLTPQVLHK